MFLVMVGITIVVMLWLGLVLVEEELVFVVMVRVAHLCSGESLINK